MTCASRRCLDLDLASYWPWKNAASKPLLREASDGMKHEVKVRDAERRCQGQCQGLGFGADALPAAAG